jgi:Cu-processing system permease protein
VRVVAAVAADILREALSRRWFLAMGIGVTLVLAGLALGLRLDVVDGALAASRLFGASLGSDIRSVDVALRPAFKAAALLIYYGGLCLGILLCADFGPMLLAPGRIEHLLALPVRRWQLLLGTFLGVLLLAVLGALYGAGGLGLILGLKTGVWTVRPVVAALLASVSFAAIYAPMLAAALFVRSAAFSAAVGGAVFVAGIVASFRAEVARAFAAGPGRGVFEALTLPLPRVASLADAAGGIAGAQPVDLGRLATLIAGLVGFALGCLALAVWRFERRDF